MYITEEYICLRLFARHGVVWSAIARALQLYRHLLVVKNVETTGAWRVQASRTGVSESQMKSSEKSYRQERLQRRPTWRICLQIFVQV